MKVDHAVRIDKHIWRAQLSSKFGYEGTVEIELIPDCWRETVRGTYMLIHSELDHVEASDLLNVWLSSEGGFVSLAVNLSNQIGFPA